MSSPAQHESPGPLTECPHCEREIRILAEWLRRRVRCSRCGKSFSVSSVRGGSQSGAGISDGDTAVLLTDGETRESPEKRESPHQRAPNELNKTSTVDRRSKGRRKSNFGRYRVVRELGAGAFGVVYLANDPELSRDVAIKLPRFSKRGETAERFRKEARSVARLRHPNIVSVFDHGEMADGVFIVYEYVPGRTLEQAIQDSEFELSQAIACVASLAEALSYAASEGLVHRDIKPANVMLDARDRPQIMDFGLAEALLGGKAATGGRIAGTPAYMSPEQARGETHVGPASDQYSLAAILYEMVTGERSVTSRGNAAIIELAERTTPPVPPLQRVAADLRAICLKAMSTDPTDRYQDCHDFATDLRRFLDGYPVAARPVPLPTRLYKWSRRNAGTAVAASIAAMLLVAVALVSSGAAVALRQRGVELSAALSDAEAARHDAERSAAEATLQRREAERQAELAMKNEQAAEQAKMHAEQALAKELEAKRLAEQAEHAAQEASQAREVALNQADTARGKLVEVAGENRSLQYVEMLTAAAVAIRGEDPSAAINLLDSCDPAQRDWEWDWLRKSATTTLVSDGSFQQLERADPELMRQLTPPGPVETYDIALRGTRATVVGPDPPHYSYRPDRSAAILASRRKFDPGLMAATSSLPHFDFTNGTTGEISVPLVPPVVARFLNDGTHVVIVGKSPAAEEGAMTPPRTGDPTNEDETPEWLTQIWDLQADQMLFEVSTSGFIPSFAVLETVGFVVGGTDESTLTVWRISDGQQVSEAELTFSLHPGPDAIRRSADDRIVLVDRDLRFHYLNPIDASLSSGPSRPRAPGARRLCWSPDQAFLAVFQTDVRTAEMPEQLTSGSWDLFDTHQGDRIGTLNAPVSKAEQYQVDTPRGKQIRYRLRQLSIEGLAVSKHEVGIRDASGGVWCWRHSGLRTPAGSDENPLVQTSAIGVNHPVNLSVIGGSCVLVADGRRVSYCMYRNGILEDPRRLRSTHRSPIHSIGVDSTGRLMASLDEAGAVHVWDLEQRARKLQLEIPNAVEVGFAFSGRKLAVVTGDGELQIYELSGQRVRDEIAHIGEVTSLLSIPSQRSVITAGADRRIRWWDLETGTQLNEKEVYLAEPAEYLAFHPNGSVAAAGGRTLTLFDLVEGRLVRRASVPLREPLDCLTFHPKGGRLFGSSGDRLFLFDAETGRRVFELPRTDDKIRALFFPDEHSVAAILSNGSEYRWQTERNGPVVTEQE